MDDHSRDDLFYMISHQVSFEKFKVLIDTMENVDKSDAGGLSYLHVAAINDRVDIVQILLQRGAYPNCVDSKGRTPLSYVIGRKLPNRIKIVQLLLEHGADLDFKTGERTIGETITMFQDPELMRIINLTLKAEDG
jgi:ankyrin